MAELTAGYRVWVGHIAAVTSACSLEQVRAKCVAAGRLVGYLLGGQDRTGGPSLLWRGEAGLCLPIQHDEPHRVRGQNASRVQLWRVLSLATMYICSDHLSRSACRRQSTYPGRTLGQKANAFLKCYQMLDPWSLHVQVGHHAKPHLPHAPHCNAVRGLSSCVPQVPRTARGPKQRAARKFDAPKRQLEAPCVTALSSCGSDGAAVLQESFDYIQCSVRLFTHYQIRGLDGELG